MEIPYTKKELEEMKEMFEVVGLPNPKHYPKSFEYYYKVYFILKYGVDKPLLNTHISNERR